MLGKLESWALKIFKKKKRLKTQYKVSVGGEGYNVTLSGGGGKPLKLLSEYGLTRTT